MDGERRMLAVAQDDPERALLDLLSHVIGEHARDAVARHRRGDRRPDGVDDEARRELHDERNRGMSHRREAPGVQPKVRHRDDLMLDEIGRFVDAGMFGEVPWRRGDDPPDFANGDRDERRVGQMRDAQCDVNAFVDQAHRPVEQLQADGDLRIALDEVVEDGAQHILTGGDRRCDREQAAGRRAFVGHQHVRFFEFSQDAPAGRRIALASLAQLDGPGGPVQQRRPRVLFKEGDGPAHRRRRAAKPARRTSQTAFVERGDEHLHRIDSVHVDSESWRPQPMPKSTVRIMFLYPPRGQTRCEPAPEPSARLCWN